MRIVAGWPSGSIRAARSRSALAAETSFDDIIRVHIEDELRRQYRGIDRSLEPGGTIPRHGFACFARRDPYIAAQN